MTETKLASTTSIDLWPEAIRLELETGAMNSRVGTRLLSETDRVRVWEIRLAPGERIGFHRHVLDYFWTAVTPGRALSRQGDGTHMEAIYTTGQTQHSAYARDAFKVHDLENIGNSELIFTTVEFLDGANSPLSLDGTRVRDD